MLVTLPSHAKNWQEWITTITHAYNCTVSSVTGFSPYFLMFGCTPGIPLDVEMGVTLIEKGDSSHQNYVQKVRAQQELISLLMKTIRKNLNDIKSIMIINFGV